MIENVICKSIQKLLINYTEDRKILFLRYLFVGGFVTVINIILLYLLKEKCYINYSLANIISMSICICITYFLSKKIVFAKKVRIGVLKEFISYILIAIISIIIDTTIMVILTEKLYIYYIFSKIIATGFSTISNYLLKKVIYDKYKY